MAKKYINIQGQLIAVSDEIYYAYYHMGRQTRTQTEKEIRRCVESYDALDTKGLLGVDLLVDKNSPSVEEIVVAKITAEKLHRCLKQLPPQEQILLHALYFCGCSERKFAKLSGIPRMTIHDRKIKALRNLKNLMEI